MRPFSSILLLFTLGLSTVRAETPIQDWVNEAIKQGGGVVTIPPGVHVLPKGILLKDAKKLALRGMDKELCVLKLPPLAYAECARAAAAGSATLPVRSARHWKAGMRLHLEADGEIDAFTKKPKPFVRAKILEVRENEFVLTAPLPFPIPIGTIIRDADAANLIEIRGESEGIEIANLTLDGGREENDPPVRGHAELCGLFAAGPYTYEKGPTGPKIMDVTLRDCILQNFFGRGAAFYSVAAAAVERCSFRDINDEAIDFDHFAVKCVARGNQITRSRIAFELNDANDCLIEGNEVRGGATGVNVWRWCKQPGLNEGNVIRNNLIEGITGNGIRLGKGTARNVIESNEVTRVGQNAISLSGEAQVVRANVISEPGMKEISIDGGKHTIEPVESR